MSEKSKKGILNTFSSLIKSKPENKASEIKAEKVMGKAIGIDLGTTNTVFGIKRVYTEILKNAEQEELTPSCVTQREGEFIVGRKALSWMKQDPENTIVSIKRLIGRNYNNEAVQKIIKEKRMGYTIQPLSTGTEQSLAVLLNHNEFTPEQISALILEKIKKDAEDVLAEEVTHVVITIPSYFNDKQKHCTRTAAALAGFKVQRLLPEPTAAAISFGVDQSREGNIHNILVYDFGGGTFDISVLTMAEGQFIEQAKGGDMWLGGNDIDALIEGYVYGLIEKENPGLKVKELIQEFPLPQKNRLLGELKEKVEKAKIELTEKETAFIDVLGLLKDNQGNPINIEIELTRTDLERVILPLIERTIVLMENVLESLHFTPEMIDKIIMVGGSSCIPLAQQKVKERFGADKVMVHKKPMLSIAEGAAILSHRLSETYECPGCGVQVKQTDSRCGACNFDLDTYIVETGVVDIVHSAAHDYYIHLEDKPPYLLVEKNTPLPVEKVEVFKLVDPRQRLVHLRFFNLVNELEESIGDLWLGIDKKEAKGDKEEEKNGKKKETQEVICKFRIDENNIIEVSARMKDHPEIQITRTMSRGKADEKVFMDLEDSIRKINSTKYESYTIYDFIHRSVNIIQEANRIVDPETGEVNTIIHKRSNQKLDKALEIVKSGDSPWGRINYARIMFDHYKNLMDPKELEGYEKVLKKLEGSDLEGTYEETKGLLAKMEKEIDKHPMASFFMSLNKVCFYYKERDPSKAEKIMAQRSKIVAALNESNFEKFDTLVKEITPEIKRVEELEGLETLRIEKGITR